MNFKECPTCEIELCCLFSDELEDFPHNAIEYVQQSDIEKYRMKYRLKDDEGNVIYFCDACMMFVKYENE
jgi:hypothetical protein